MPNSIIKQYVIIQYNGIYLLTSDSNKYRGRPITVSVHLKTVNFKQEEDASYEKK